MRREIFLICCLLGGITLYFSFYLCKHTMSDWSTDTVLLAKYLPNAVDTRLQNADNVSLLYAVDWETENKTSIKGGPLSHLDDYKNPCWLSRLDISFPYESNHYRSLKEYYRGGSSFNVEKTFLLMSKKYKRRLTEGEPWRLRCLPHVYLVGVTKSGTSDLFENIIRHPDILPAAVKEPMWWNRHRLGRERIVQVIPYTFSEYVDLFDNAAEQIWQSVVKNAEGRPYHQKITIDGSPSYLWDYDGWQMVPGNLGLQEPRYILAHSLKALTPNCKIIVIIREPGERLYSQFRMWRGGVGSETFHRAVVQVIGFMKECLKKRTLRSCVYDPSVNPSEFKKETNYASHTFLRASMYYVFLRDWFDVFPRDQILVINAERYYGNRSTVMRKVYQFLDVTPWNDSLMKNPNQRTVVNTGRSKEPMLAKTRHLLDEFFAPYNRMLADLLNDTSFLFKQ